MIWRNTAEQYGIVAKGLHWLVAVLVIAMIGVGLYMSGQDPSPSLFQLYAWHKSVGITILLLAVLRLVWKLSGRRPSPLPGHRAWEKHLALAIHGLLYAALFLMPISGWIMSSAKDFSVSFFGLFTLPDLVSPDEDLAELAEEVHEVAAYALIAMIVLHFAGAMKHHLIDRDATLRRMLPGLALAFVFVPGLAMAQDKAPSWTIMKEESAIRFEAVQMGAPFEGRFGAFDGTILFDPDNLPGSHAEITIDIGSLDATSADRNKYLPMADWFALSSYPVARFVTKSMERGLESAQFVARGDLTIRNVTLPVTLPFRVTFENDAVAGTQTAIMSGETTVNRLDFGVGQGEWKDTKTVGAEVRVLVAIRAVRKL